MDQLDDITKEDRWMYRQQLVPWPKTTGLRSVDVRLPFLKEALIMMRMFTRIVFGIVLVGAMLFGWNRTAAAQGGLAFSINDITVTEGDSGTTNAFFTVALSGRRLNTVSVKLQLANGSARVDTDVVNVTPALSAPAGKLIVVNAATANGSATAPSDYAAKRGRLIFVEGQTSKAFVVSLVTDSTHESNETLRLNLTNPANGTAIEDALGLIVNDYPVPSMRINDFRVAETNAGTAR
jgi:hypothetical protein